MKNLGTIGLMLGALSVLGIFMEWEMHWIVPGAALFCLWGSGGFKTPFSDVADKEDIEKIIKDALAEKNGL